MRRSQASRQTNALVFRGRRHPNVGYEQIRALLVDQASDRTGVFALTDDRDRRDALEQVLERQAHQIGVVGEDDANRGAVVHNRLGECRRTHNGARGIRGCGSKLMGLC